MEGRGLPYNGTAGLPQDPHNHGATPPSARPDVEPLADRSPSTASSRQATQAATIATVSAQVLNVPIALGRCALYAMTRA